MARCTNETTRVLRRDHGLPRRRAPVHLAAQHAVAHVQRTRVVLDGAVAQVKRLVVDEQAQDLAVRDVDHRLAGLGVAVGGLGVGQRPRLEEAVEVGPRAARRLTLVEVAAQADVAVGEREDRLRLRQQVEPELVLGDRPGVDAVDVLADHGGSLPRLGHGSSADARLAIGGLGPEGYRGVIRTPLLVLPPLAAVPV